jgi:hypothetical protein
MRGAVAPVRFAPHLLPHVICSGRDSRAPGAPRLLFRESYSLLFLSCSSVCPRKLQSFGRSSSPRKRKSSQTNAEQAESCGFKHPCRWELAGICRKYALGIGAVQIAGKHTIQTNVAPDGGWTVELVFVAASSKSRVGMKGTKFAGNEWVVSDYSYVSAGREESGD